MEKVLIIIRRGIAFSLYIGWRFVRFIKLLWASSPHGKMTVAGVAVLIVVLVYYWGWGALPSDLSLPPLQAQEDTQIRDDRSKHTCNVEPFSQAVNRGGSVAYEVSLRPSSNREQFALTMGDLPGGTTFKFDSRSGRAPKDVGLTFTTAVDAQTGSFNIVVIYNELDGSNEPLPNFCQLNLIVR